MCTSHVVLEGFSGLGLEHGELKTIALKEIMFGIINNDSKFCLALNHLVIIGKYFLYVKAFNGRFNKFVSLARNKISLEKYIFCTTGHEKDFRTKWSVFSSVLSTV